MAKETAISWAEATWNPWHGCEKVSPGCKFCYMYREKERYGQDPKVVKRSKTTFFDPLRWARKGETWLTFTCSYSDWFIEYADEWREEAWQIVRDTPHYYQILTKRPERIMEHLPADWGEGYPNVGLGVSIENQEMADRRLRLFESVPARMKFLSLEPLLSSIYLGFFVQAADWWIVGGESGNETGKWRYRECKLEWIEWLVTQAEYAKKPVWVKQTGTALAHALKLRDNHGKDITEWPRSIQIQQFPPQIEEWRKRYGKDDLSLLSEGVRAG